MLPLHVLLALALTSMPVNGPAIHRCEDAAGAVIYQQTPCPPDMAAETLPIRPQDVRPAAPAGPPSQDEADNAVATPQPSMAPAPTSWLCLAQDGTRFYRHDGCPTQLSVRRPQVWVGETPVTVPVFVSVRALRVERRAACEAIYDRGASRRSGSEHDQRYTVYERATGRDPCR